MRWSIPVLALAAAFSPLFQHSSHADETATSDVQVAVELKDGSRLNARVAAATDANLTLRFSAPGVSIQRSVPWKQIASATIGSRTYSAAELQPQLMNSAFNHGVPLSVERPQLSPAAAPEKPRVVTFSNPEFTPTATRRMRVQSLEVSAEVANWDRDAVIDGIRVYVRPLSSDGSVVPVTGTLNVKLFGQAFMQAGGIRDQRRFDAFPELGEWSMRVRKQDFDEQGATYQLVFRRGNPEFYRQLGAYSLTHARLSVAGEGVFEASDAMTQTRPFSPYRDWHEHLTGKRFLPQEHAR